MLNRNQYQRIEHSKDVQKNKVEADCFRDIKPLEERLHGEVSHDELLEGVRHNGVEHNQSPQRELE